MNFEVTTGKKKQPFNIAIAGVAGIGKSTFGSKAPKPLVMGAEETGELDIARLPKLNVFQDAISQAKHLIANKGLGYQTLVVDTVDSIEQLLHKELLETDPKKTNSMVAAHGGYGKAYDMAASQMLAFRSLLQILRDEHGMNLIFLTHTKKVQTTDTILGMVYDTYEMALHPKVQSVFADYVSAVLFATYVTHQQTGANTDKIFALGEGERVLLTEKRPGHIGKNRFSLPYEMPLSFDAFYKAYNDFFNEGPSTSAIMETIFGLTANITDEALVQKIKDQVKSAANNMDKLIKIEQRVREIIK